MSKRIFLISPYPLFLEGLRALLQASPETFVVAGAGASLASADPASLGNSDVLFLDLSQHAEANEVLASAREARNCCEATIILMIDSDSIKMSSALRVDARSSVVSRYISPQALLELVKDLPAGIEADAQSGPGDERRRHLRIPVHTPVRIGSLQGEIKDISATGMYIQIQHALEHRVGDTLTLEVEFPGAGGRSVLICEGRIVRKILIGQMTGLAVEVTSSYSPGG